MAGFCVAPGDLWNIANEASLKDASTVFNYNGIICLLVSVVP